MKRWVAFGIALVLAVATALGLGWVRRERWAPTPWQWATIGETLDLRGSRWTPTGFGEIAVDDALSAQAPPGSVYAAVEIRQEVVTLPQNVNTDLLCSIVLVNGSNEWDRDRSITNHLEWRSDCWGLGEGLVAGQTRLVRGAWLVPRWAIYEGDPHVEVRFSGRPAAFGIRPAP